MAFVVAVHWDIVCLLGFVWLNLLQIVWHRSVAWGVSEKGN